MAAHIAWKPLLAPACLSCLGGTAHTWLEGRVYEERSFLRLPVCFHLASLPCRNPIRLSSSRYPIDLQAQSTLNPD
jgi:hypothetical protein